MASTVVKIRSQPRSEISAGCPPLTSMRYPGELEYKEQACVAYMSLFVSYLETLLVTLSNMQMITLSFRGISEVLLDCHMPLFCWHYC